MRLKPLLTWCALCIGAYAGALLRYGFSFFKTGPAGDGSSALPSAATGVLLANIVGSFCLGVASMWQAALASKSAPRLSRVAYAGFASGFCGTLTTFSGWQAEAARPLLWQLEGVSAAPNGTGVISWLLLLLIGALVPLAALRAGQQLGHVVQAWQQRRAEALGFAASPLPPPPLLPPVLLAPSTAAAVEAVTEAVDTALHEQAPGLPVDRDANGGPQGRLLGLREEGGVSAAASDAQRPDALAASPAAVATPVAPGLLAASGGVSSSGSHVPRVDACAAVIDIEVPIAGARAADDGDDVAGHTAASRRVSFRLASAMPLTPSSPCGDAATPRPAGSIAASVAQVCIIAAYAAATAVLTGVLLPLARYDLAIMLGLACLGAYARYRLAVLNQPIASSSTSSTAGMLQPPTGTLLGRWRRAAGAHLQPFPLGTLLVNVVGTWLFGAVVVLARRVVSADASGTQALLFGASAGFCGAFTTMSTFVLELRRLPLHVAYWYAAVSTAAAQLGFLLIVGLGITSGRAAF